MKQDVIFQGLAYTVMGVVVVFAMLVLIMFVIKGMQLFSKAPEPEKAKAPQAPKAEPVQAKPDDTELIAVITAAIAASLGKSTTDFVVRSYKRMPAKAWRNAGRAEALNNRI